MKEIYRMWRMIRLLMKDRFTWADQLILREATQRVYKVNGEIITGRRVDKTMLQFEASRDLLNYNKEARVKRKGLCMAYILKYYPALNINKLGGIGFNFEDEKFKEKYLIAQSIIDSCIDNDFIKSEMMDGKLIYLSGRGKKFMGIDGLLKEFIRELGVLWGGIVWAMSLLTAANWGWVANIARRSIHLLFRLG